jgi:hypothetical protein
MELERRYERVKNKSKTKQKGMTNIKNLIYFSK